MARTAHAPARQLAEHSTIERQKSVVAQPPSSSQSNSQPKAPSAAGESVQESIAALAYSFWLERRGSDQGSAEEDWFRAERKIRARQPPPS